MSKKFKTIAALLLAFAMVFSLAACSSSNEPQGNAGDATEPEKVEDFYVKIATGNQGGTYYPIGIAMANVFSEKIPGCISSGMATGGSVDNIGLLRDEEVQIAMIMSTTCESAYTGTGVFEGNGYSELRAMTALWENNVQIIVKNDITDIHQLEGKRFVVGANASGTELDTRAIFNAFGLYYNAEDASKNNVTPEYLDYNQGVDALKDGQVSGVMNNSHAPASAITDLLSTGDYHILEFTDEELEIIKAANSLYDVYTVPANSYPNQDHDIKTIGYPVLLTCPESADADTIYKLVEAIFDNTDTLVAAHSAAASITLENAVKGLIIPLHEGAERYFKEKGAL